MQSSLDGVYAVFALRGLLRQQSDHFLWGAWRWLWRGLALCRLELDNGLEESHGVSFQGVRGVASLSNVFCLHMVDYLCEFAVTKTNAYLGSWFAFARIKKGQQRLAGVRGADAHG